MAVRLRRWVRILLALAGLMLLCYALLPWLVEAQLRAQLRDAGFTTVAVDVGYPGTDGIVLRSLELELDLPDSMLTLRLPTLTLGYDPGSLRRGRFGKITFDGGVAELGPPQRVAAQTDIDWPLPGPWIAAVPFDEILVTGLVLRERSADRLLREGLLTGAVQRQGDRLDARLRLYRGEQALAEATLALAGSGDLDFVLRSAAQSAAPAASASTRLLPAGNGHIDIRGSLELHPARLAALWHGRARDNFGGSLAASLQGRLPAATADLDRVWSAADLALRVDANLTADELSGVGRKLALLAGADAVLRDGELALTLHNGARFSGLLDALQPVSRFAANGSGLAAPAPVTLTLEGDAELTVQRGPRHWMLTLPAGLDVSLRNTLMYGYSIPAIHLRSTRSGTIQFGAAGTQIADLQLALAAPNIVTPFAGIGELQDLKAAVRARTGPGGLAAVVNDAGVGLLGGRVRVRRLDYGPGTALAPFELHLEQIDLARLVALERRSDLEASGSLDGTLPITVTAAGVGVSAGRLSARPPGGIIRFRPGDEARALATGNASLKLVYQALGNLHYRRLDTTLDYHPDGRLLLAAALAGHNPDWNAGQAVNLNLNLEENVLQLLESLYIGERLGKEFEAMVQDHYKSQRLGR